VTWELWDTFMVAKLQNGGRENSGW